MGGGRRWWRRGKPQKGDLFTLAHALYGRLETKWVFYYLCCVVAGWGGERVEREGGEMPLFAEEEAAWPVPTALPSGGPADLQKAGKEKTNPRD